jgi:hypothetical protein
MPIDKMSVSVLYDVPRRIGVSTYHLLLISDLRRAMAAVTISIRSIIAKRV